MHGGSSASKAGNLLFWGTVLPQKPKIRQIGERVGHAHSHVNITVWMHQRKHHFGDAPFVEYRAACGRRIGMCGWRSVPTESLLLSSMRNFSPGHIV